MPLLSGIFHARFSTISAAAQTFCFFPLKAENSCRTQKYQAPH